MAPAAQTRTLSLLFLLCAIAGLVIRFVNVGNPLNDWDETTYAVIARTLMAGDLPYRSAFDHKPIALYYIYALFFWVFDYSMSTVRLMPFVSIGLTAWVMHRITKAHFPADRRRLLICTALFMLTCASFGNGGLASNTEIIQMPLIAAWWLVVLGTSTPAWRRPLMMGILAGLTAHINYLGGFVLAVSTAAFLAWPLCTRAGLPSLKAFVLDGIMALGAFLAISLLLLSPLIFSQELGQYFAMQRAMLSVYQGTLNSDKLVRAVLSTAIPTCAFLALLTSMAWHRRERPTPTPFLNRLAGMLGLVAVVTLLAIYQTKRLYPHYFNLLLVPSTLALMALLSIAGALTLRRFFYAALLITALMIARGAWDAHFKDRQQGFRLRNEVAQLTREIQKYSRPGDHVMLFSVDHTLYVLADVLPATRYFFSGTIFNDRLMASFNSSPEREVQAALASGPVFVMACYDDQAGRYRTLIEGALAARFQAYTLAGYTTCRDLVAYRPKLTAAH